MGGLEDRGPALGPDRLTHQQALKLGLCPKCRRKTAGGECRTCDNRKVFDPVATSKAAG